MLPNNQQEVLEKAINAIYRETGLRLEIIELEKKDQQFGIDAILGIEGYEPLQFAAENWAKQKEPYDARTLMEAAIAARRPEAARPALEWMRATGYEEARYRALALRLESGAK